MGDSPFGNYLPCLTIGHAPDRKPSIAIATPIDESRHNVPYMFHYANPAVTCPEIQRYPVKAAVPHSLILIQQPVALHRRIWMSG